MTENVDLLWLSPEDHLWLSSGKDLGCLMGRHLLTSGNFQKIIGFVKKGVLCQETRQRKAVSIMSFSNKDVPVKKSYPHYLRVENCVSLNSLNLIRLFFSIEV